jgi:hypothetical protein
LREQTMPCFTGSSLLSLLLLRQVDLTGVAGLEDAAVWQLARACRWLKQVHRAYKEGLKPWLPTPCTCTPCTCTLFSRTRECIKCLLTRTSGRNSLPRCHAATASLHQVPSVNLPVLNLQSGPFYICDPARFTLAIRPVLHMRSGPFYTCDPARFTFSRGWCLLRVVAAAAGVVRARVRRRRGPARGLLPAPRCSQRARLPQSHRRLRRQARPGARRPTPSHQVTPARPSSPARTSRIRHANLAWRPHPPRVRLILRPQGLM